MTYGIILRSTTKKSEKDLLKFKNFKIVAKKIVISTFNFFLGKRGGNNIYTDTNIKTHKKFQPKRIERAVMTLFYLFKSTKILNNHAFQSFCFFVALLDSVHAGSVNKNKKINGG